MSSSPSTEEKKSSKHHKSHNSDSPLSFLHNALPFLPKLSNENDEAILIGAVAGATFLLLFILFCMCCCCCCKRKKMKHKTKNNGKVDPQQQRQPSDIHLKMPPTSSSDHQAPTMVSNSQPSSSGPYQPPLPPPHPLMAFGFNQNSFTYDDLAAATRGFDKSLLLGQGGFGYVYKGVLPNGKEVAVKSLKAGSGQGEREFQAEVEIISRVHHRHLVSIVGYCIAGEKRMLVYEFIPNRTLEYHLHGKGRSVIDCSTRLKIALGAAKGFAYLHEDCNPRIIHRDIKAANILIDNQFEAKVADFGLAKLSSVENTHVSTRIMGTFGYLAPEYASTGKLTEKSDVFSFGIVLLELITGRKPVEPNNDDDNDSLIDWARPILMQTLDGGSFEEIVDPSLKGNYNRDEMHRMVACAAACIRHSAKKRPKMSQVVRALEGNVSLEILKETRKKDESEYDMHSYNRRHRSRSKSSQEFSSSEHDAM